MKPLFLFICVLILNACATQPPKPVNCTDAGGPCARRSLPNNGPVYS